tara:strand:+ start:189 stop:497 length:309 start_codon:yes stop_codon:yes gene_type:complete
MGELKKLITEKTLYKPFVSKAKNKKYSVYVKGDDGKTKLINFGDKRYEQFKDKIGHYSYLNHNDKERRKRYLTRAKGIKNKKGELTYKDKNTPNYWSVNFLW